MNYEWALSMVFASGTIANGFNGDTIKVGFALCPTNNQIWCVAPCGCFNWGYCRTQAPVDTLKDSRYIKDIVELTPDGNKP